MSDNPQMLPPIDFSLYVSGYVSQAFVFLGKIPNPENGETSVNLPLAKHLIDILGMLEDKTQGNLTSEEESFLQHQLQTLRLNYVDVAKSEEQGAGDAPGADAEIEGSKSEEAAQD
jgi:hypothetical protein